MRKSLPKVPVMALTATATEAVRNDIVENLKLVSPRITVTGFDRFVLLLLKQSLNWDEKSFYRFLSRS